MTEYQGRLNKEDYVVLPVSLYTARILVERLHYAKSGSNTATYTHGLFKKDAQFLETDCLGITWWLPPTKNAAINTYPEGEWQKVLSLSRMVIAHHVPKNACSFLLSRSIKMIDNQKWECLVTYADTWQNHEGTIYKATNWEYVGQTKATEVFIGKTGKMMGRKRGPRTLLKSEMIKKGFVEAGKHIKHKFRKIIKPKK